MNNDNDDVVPRKIKGFRDISHNLNQIRWEIINAAIKVYQSYGFEHWDTPTIEYADCLGKYLPDTDTVEQGVYSFKNPETEPTYSREKGEIRDQKNNVIMKNHFLSLRYDLTAPLARHYAENLWKDYLKNNLTENKTPLFRRYQFGPVFRLEAKLDPGRFREFWQLDFDSVGTNDLNCDAEVCMMLSDALEAIGLQRDSYIIKVNNRKILKGLLNEIGADGEKLEQDILRVIDKTDKIGVAGVKQELGKGRMDASGAKINGLGLNTTLVNKIIDFLEAFPKKNNRKLIVQSLSEKLNNEIAQEGIEELKKIDKILTTLNFQEDRILFDPTLVRGLAYYTGPVFEVESKQSYIDEKGRERKFGAICAGGRYDGLVSNLLGIKVPATGASIGVDRLAELLTLTKQTSKQADRAILIVVFEEKKMPEYQKIAHQLRQANINVEIYYGQQRGLKKQLAYADKKNSPLAILLGEDELKKGTVTVKDLTMGKQLSDIKSKEEWKEKVQFEVKRENLIPKIKQLLNK